MKQKKGITLIALVVTIIVLIILAGVSINLILGDNGIVIRAKQAKTNTEQAKKEEEVQMNEIDEFIEEEVSKKETLSEIIGELGWGNLTLEEIIQDEEKMRVLGNSERALKVIKKSVEDSNIIGDSDYWRLIYKNDIPIMTSNTEPRGEATSSPLIYSTNLPYHAFENGPYEYCTRCRTKFLGSI